MTREQLDVALLLGAAVLLIGIVAVRLAARVGLPSLLAYLGIGVLLGEDALGVRFDDARLAQVLGIAALVVILVEGGLGTDWGQVRPVLPQATLLATVGVAVSVAVTAYGAHLLLRLDWRTALLAGAVVSSTDAAAVFSVLRRMPLPTRLRSVLEAESGLNDAPVVLLVTLLATMETARSPWQLGALVGYELAAGALVGLGVGWVGAALLRSVALPASGLYPLAALAFGVLGYAGAAVLQASGFLAAYLAGVVLGNSRLPHGLAVRSFAEGLGWLAQIGLFVMLGLLAVPHRLPGELLPAVAVGLVLLLVARPLSVLVALTPLRVAWREQAFLSWAGLRGAVPVVLATIPVVEGVPGAARVFDAVFVLVVVFTLVQAPLLPAVARRLGLAGEGAVDLEVDSAPLGRLGAELLSLTVGSRSRLHGVEVGELRLPSPAAVTLVVREGRAFVPDATTVLRHGDELLVVTTGAARPGVERRLRAVSRGGRLAGWYGEGPGA